MRVQRSVEAVSLRKAWARRRGTSLTSPAPRACPSRAPSSRQACSGLPSSATDRIQHLACTTATPRRRVALPPGHTETAETAKTDTPKPDSTQTHLQLAPSRGCCSPTSS